MRPLHTPRTPAKRPATTTPSQMTTAAQITRKLTHTTQDPVQVYCRLRPNDHENNQSCVIPIDDKLIKTNVGNEVPQVFSFERVFPETASQNEVFNCVCLPLVEDLVAGKNGLLFAYGVTSSGKTYTIEGLPSDCGLLPRTIDVLFNSIGENQTEKFQIRPDGQNNFIVQDAAERMLRSTRDQFELVKSTPSKLPSVIRWQRRKRESAKVEADPLNSYCVFISLIELYNRRVVDLLDESSGADPRKKKEIRDHSGLCYVANLVEKEVKDADEAIEVFNRGLSRRVTAKTALNSESSRSHCVFNIRLVQARKTYDGEVDEDTMQVSQLCLVDLAGSERSKRTGATGGTLQEAGNINKSLTALRQCIAALREKDPTMIPPYREHSLTRLFKSYFEGQGSVRMILCVNPHREEYTESLYAMQFGVQAQDVVIEKAHYVNPVREFKDRMLAMGNDGYIADDDIDMDDDSIHAKLYQEWRMKREQTANVIVAFKQSQVEFRKRLVAAASETDKLKDSIKEKQNEIRARDEQIKLLESEARAKDRSRECMMEKLKTLQRECKSLEAKLLEEKRNKEMLQRDKDQAEANAAKFVRNERAILKRKLEGLMRKDCCVSKEKLDSFWRSLGVVNLQGSGRENLDLPLRLAADHQRVAPSAPPRLSPMQSTPTELDERAGHGGGSSSTSDLTQPHATTPSDRMTTRSRSSEKRGIASVGANNGRVPYFNPRSTRSLSTGSLGKWIYHCPKGTLDMGTVLVPKIKNRKSVCALESKDFLRKDVAGYALAHHEADENGDIETSIFKGKIVKSEGGGANIIFDDIEMMRQVSPPSKRKRASSDALPMAITNPCSPVSSNSTSERETSVKKYRL